MKPLREAIEEILVTAPNRYCEKNINGKYVNFYEIPDPQKTVDQILELFESAIPKDRLQYHAKENKLGKVVEWVDYFDEGYNQCIADIKEKLGK